MIKLSNNHLLLLKLPVTIIFLFYFNILSAQTIVSDSKGNDVFNFNMADIFSANIETGKDEVSFNYNKPIHRFFKYVGDTTNKTFAFSRCLQGTVRLFSSNGNLNFNALKKSNPGFEMNFGYQRTIDKIYDIDRISKLNNWGPIKGWAKSYGLAPFFRMDNAKLYDSTSSSLKQDFPLSFGVLGNVAFYRFRQFAIQISGVWKGSNNLDDLTLVYENKPNFSNSQVVSFESEPIGRLGKTEYLEIRQFSIAIPFFLLNTPIMGNEGVFKSMVLRHISITPYYTFEERVNLKTNHTYGFMINYLDKALTNKDYTINRGIGLGIDWTNGNWDYPIIFARGTLNVGSFTEKNRDPR